jgi:hypothetical protein
LKRAFIAFTCFIAFVAFIAFGVLAAGEARGVDAFGLDAFGLGPPDDIVGASAQAMSFSCRLYKYTHGSTAGYCILISCKDESA